MDKAEIKSRVEKVTAQVLKIDPKEITPNANFAFDLGVFAVARKLQADDRKSLRELRGFIGGPYAERTNSPAFGFGFGQAEDMLAGLQDLRPGIPRGRRGRRDTRNLLSIVTPGFHGSSFLSAKIDPLGGMKHSFGAIKLKHGSDSLIFDDVLIFTIIDSAAKVWIPPDARGRSDSIERAL